jgi:putative transposase
MSKHRIYDQQGINYLTLTTVGWIDAFTRRRYKDILIQSLQYCQTHKGLNIIGYVIMSNHIHLIAYTTEGSNLSDVLRDFKKYTAKQIIASIQNESESRRDWLLYLFQYFAKHNTNNRDFQFWQQDNHPIALWTLSVMWQKLNYIHLNPVRAGLVKESTDYVYSSATNYYTREKGLLDIDLLEPLGPVPPIYT